MPGAGMGGDYSAGMMPGETESEHDGSNINSGININIKINYPTSEKTESEDEESIDWSQWNEYNDTKSAHGSRNSSLTDTDHAYLLQDILFFFLFIFKTGLFNLFLKPDFLFIFKTRLQWKQVLHDFLEQSTVA